MSAADEIDMEAVEARETVSTIIARERARRCPRSQTRAPDFYHGDCRLEAIYDAFGPAWCERAVFVEEIRDGRGSVAAYSAASFDRRFLELQHAVRGEDFAPGTSFVDWSSVDPDDSFIVSVTLHDHELAADLREVSAVSIHSSSARLEELERDELGLVRDRRFRSRREFFRATDELLLESRLNLMSVICLSARCGRA
ncbi:MAG: hypothetical protein ABEL76_17095 [Bradymonadaceae bacterium]